MVGAFALGYLKAEEPPEMRRAEARAGFAGAADGRPDDDAAWAIRTGEGC